MPIQFPTNLSVGAGSSHTLLDLRENKVQGIGFFDSLEEAQGLNANQRCLGYLAIVSDGTNPGTVYQFTGVDVNSWTSNDSWAVIGSAGNGNGDGTKVLHHNLSCQVALSQSVSTVNGVSVQSINPTVGVSSIVEELELRFDGDKTLGYNVASGGTPYPVDPEFVKDLAYTAANRFESVDGQTPISSCVITATASIGDATFPLETGISSAYTTELSTANWTGTAAETEISNYLGTLYNKICSGSQAGTPLPAADFMFAPIIPVRAGNGTIYFLTFTNPAASITYADFTDSANWTAVWNTGPVHIGVYAWIYENGIVNAEVLAGGQSPSIQSIGTGANVGVTGTLNVDQRISTLEQLKERLRIKLKLSNSAKSALADTVTNANNSFSWKDLYMRIDLGITITQ